MSVVEKGICCVELQSQDIENMSLFSSNGLGIDCNNFDSLICHQFVPCNIELDLLTADFQQQSGFTHITNEASFRSDYPDSQLDLSQTHYSNQPSNIVSVHHSVNELNQNISQTLIHSYYEFQQFQKIDEEQLCKQLLRYSNISPQNIRLKYLSKIKMKYIDRQVFLLKDQQTQIYNFLLPVFKYNIFELFQRFRTVSKLSKDHYKSNQASSKDQYSLNLTLRKFNMSVFSQIDWGKLTKLDLQACFLYDQDWKVLVNNFNHFKQIQILNISNNGIREVSQADIYQLLRCAPSLNYLNLLQNPLDIDSLDELRKVQANRFFNLVYDKEMMKLNETRNEQIEEFSLVLKSQCNEFVFQQSDQIEEMYFYTDICKKINLMQQNQAKTQLNQAKTQHNQAKTQHNEAKKQSNRAKTQLNRAKTQPNQAKTQHNEAKADELSTQDSKDKVDDTFFAVDQSLMNYSLRSQDIVYKEMAMSKVQESFDKFSQDLLKRQIVAKTGIRRLKHESKQNEQVFERMLQRGLENMVRKYFRDLKNDIRKRQEMNFDENQLVKYQVDQISIFQEELIKKIIKWVKWAINLTFEFFSIQTPLKENPNSITNN